MERKGSIGILEIQHYGNALIACDIVSKAGDVDMIYNKNNLGGRLVTMVFEGSESNLAAAFERVTDYFSSTKLLKVCEVVPNPTKELMDFFEKGDFGYHGE
jgi:microcompartment protein CcmL/EutN